MSKCFNQIFVYINRYFQIMNVVIFQAKFGFNCSINFIPESRRKRIEYLFWEIELKFMFLELCGGMQFANDKSFIKYYECMVESTNTRWGIMQKGYCIEYLFTRNIIRIPYIMECWTGPMLKGYTQPVKVDKTLIGSTANLCTIACFQYIAICFYCYFRGSSPLLVSSLFG